MKIARRNLIASSICFAWLGCALYACSGDDTTNNGNNGTDGSAGDGTVADSGFADRQVSDSASNDSGGGDAQSDVFLPNQPYVCGGASCDFGSSACCNWTSLDGGGAGGECLPLGDFDGGPLPCEGHEVIDETNCFRATECGGNCQIFPLGGTIFGNCRDAGAGTESFACDLTHPCASGLHCQRLICGPNEAALCLADDAGPISFCTEVP